MPDSQKIGLLRRAGNSNDQLLQAWSAVETIIANSSTAGTNTPITYKKYMDYLVQHADMLEEGAMNNTNRKANKMNTYDMDSYDLNHSYYDEATDLSTYMGNLGDVDALQYTL